MDKSHTQQAGDEQVADEQVTTQSEDKSPPEKLDDSNQPTAQTANQPTPQQDSEANGDTKTTDLSPDTTRSDTARENEDDESFVLLQPDDSFDIEQNRVLFYKQMETYLVNQINKCGHYKDYFDKQGDSTLSNKFATNLENSTRYLETLKTVQQSGDYLPQFTIENVECTCTPVNVDVREKELQVRVRTNLAADKDALVYVIGEFSFPITGSSDDNLIGHANRWYRYLKIEPKNAICCSDVSGSRQLDLVYATKAPSFREPKSKLLEYERPLSFFVDKGKSRTLKRKFKPIKLIFYEQTNLLKFDKRLGSIQVKIDDINDDNTLIIKQTISCGRKAASAECEIEVKVREPLVNKSARKVEEQLLVLKDM